MRGKMLQEKKRSKLHRNYKKSVSLVCFLFLCLTYLSSTYRIFLNSKNVYFSIPSVVGLQFPLSAALCCLPCLFSSALFISCFTEVHWQAINNLSLPAFSPSHFSRSHNLGWTISTSKLKNVSSNLSQSDFFATSCSLEQLRANTTKIRNYRMFNSLYL